MLNIMKTRARTVTQNRFLRRLMLHFDYLQDETGSMHQASTVIFLLANLYIQAVPTNTRSDSCLNGILGSSKWVPAILVLGLVTPLLVICLLATSLFFEDSLIDNRNNLQTPAHLKSHWYRIYKHLYRFNFLLLEPIVSGYMISLILTVSKDDDSDYGIGFTICAIIGGILGLILNLTYLFFVESILPNDSITSGTNRVNIALTTLALRMCLALDRYFTYIDSQAVRAVIMSIRLIPSVVAMQVNLFSTYFFNRSARLFFSGYQISNIIYSITVFIEGGSSYAITIIPASLFIVLALRWVYNVDLLEKSNLRNPSTSRLLDVISLSGYLFYKQNGLEDLASVPGLNFQAVMAHRTDNRFVQYEEFIEKFASAEERTEDDEKNAILFVTYMYERLWHETGEKNFKVLVYEMMWALTMRPNLLHLSILLARFNTLEMNPVQQSTYRSVVRKLETICKEIYLDKQSLLPIKEQFYAPKSVAEINESVAFKQKMNINDDDSKDGAENAKQTSSTGKSDLLHFDVYSSMQTIEQYERLVGKMQEVISTILKFYDKLKNRVVEIASAHETMKTVKQLKESVSKSFRDLDRLSGEQNLFHLLPYALFLETINNDRQASQKILKVFEHRSQVVQRNLIMARDRSSYTKFNLDLMLCIGVDCTKNSLGRMNYVSSNCEEVFGVQPKNFEGRNVNSLMSDDFQTIHDEFMDKFVKDQDKPYLGVSRERHVRIREQIYTKCDVLVKLAPVLNPTSLSFMCLLKRHTSDEEFIVLNHQGVIVGRSQGLDWAAPPIQRLMNCRLSNLSSELDKVVKSALFKVSNSKNRKIAAKVAAEDQEAKSVVKHRTMSIIPSRRLQQDSSHSTRLLERFFDMAKIVRDDPTRYVLRLPGENPGQVGPQYFSHTLQEVSSQDIFIPQSKGDLQKAELERYSTFHPANHVARRTLLNNREVEARLSNLNVSLRTTTYRQMYTIVYSECWLMVHMHDNGPSNLDTKVTVGENALHEFSREPQTIKEIPMLSNIGQTQGHIPNPHPSDSNLERSTIRQSDKNSSLSLPIHELQPENLPQRFFVKEASMQPNQDSFKLLPKKMAKSRLVKPKNYNLAKAKPSAPNQPAPSRLQVALFDEQALAEQLAIKSRVSHQSKGSSNRSDSESIYTKQKLTRLVVKHSKRLVVKEMVGVFIVQIVILLINLVQYTNMDTNFVKEMSPRIQIRAGLEFLVMEYGRLYDVGRNLHELLLIDQGLMPLHKYEAVYPWYNRTIENMLHKAWVDAGEFDLKLHNHVLQFDAKYAEAFKVRTYKYKYPLVGSNTTQTQKLDVLTAPRATLYEGRVIHDSIIQARKDLAKARQIDPQHSASRPDLMEQQSLYNYVDLMGNGWNNYTVGTVLAFIDIDGTTYIKLINRSTLYIYVGITGCFALACGLLLLIYLIRRKVAALYLVFQALYEYEVVFYENKLAIIEQTLNKCAYSSKHDICKSTLDSLAVCSSMYDSFKNKHKDHQSRLKLRYQMGLNYWFGLGLLVSFLFIIIQVYTVTSYDSLSKMSAQSVRKLELMTYHRRVSTTNGVLNSLNYFAYVMILQKSGLSLSKTNFTAWYNFEAGWIKRADTFIRELEEFIFRDAMHKPAESANLLDLINLPPCNFFHGFEAGASLQHCQGLADGAMNKSMMHVLQWIRLNNERLLYAIKDATPANVMKLMTSPELLQLEMLRREYFYPHYVAFTREFYRQLFQYHEDYTIWNMKVLLLLLSLSIYISLGVSIVFYFKLQLQVNIGLTCMHCIPFESYQHNLYVSSILSKLENKK